MDAAVTEGIGRFQGFCPTAKGTPKWWDVIVSAVHDAAGQPIRFVSVSRDITEQKQAENEIRRLLHEAERREQELREKQTQLVQSAKLASIGELTSGVAHEINNPLNNIGMFVGNVLETLDDPQTDSAF